MTYLLNPQPGFAQFRDSLTRSDSSNMYHEKKVSDNFWLIAAFDIDLVSPNVGNDANVLGFGFKLGATFKHAALIFADHSTRGALTGIPSEEHRYDNSLLFGYSNRTEGILYYLTAGVGAVSYLLRGAVITPPSSPYGTDGSWEVRDGTTYGISGMANIFATPLKYLGIGTGLYVSLAKGVSYFALELSLIELNVPISVE